DTAAGCRSRSGRNIQTAGRVRLVGGPRLGASPVDPSGGFGAHLRVCMYAVLSPVRHLPVVHGRCLTTCPECGQQALRKVFSPVGVVFKGSGFYRTDSRSTETSS